MRLDESVSALDPELISRFASIPCTTAADAMDRMGVVDSRIHAIWPGARVVGPAFTVWTRSGDNLFVNQALEHVRPGDVIVVNGQGDESRALIGDLLAARARARQVAGFVIDGAVRDVEGLAELGLPVFARRVTPAGPYKFGPGALGRTIAVGGVAVAPGDLVLGDADGVVIVPRAEAQAVLSASEALLEQEELGRRGK
jgi:regulator of RNase E activity RraA